MGESGLVFYVLFLWFAVELLCVGGWLAGVGEAIAHVVILNLLYCH